jgi:tRNA (mo5U34)-methyltransferase
MLPNQSGSLPDATSKPRPLAELKQELIALGPWHQDIPVTPELSTGVWREAAPSELPEHFRNMSLFPAGLGAKAILNAVYGSAGLDGRSVLDCACNAGGYGFGAREVGASRVFGFDAREHWIRQADWLASNRHPYPSDGTTFQVANLYDLPALHLGQFDVTFFMGIFYHLADPFSGLKVIAEMTRELLIVGTATRNGYPEDCLVLNEENPQHHLSGVESLNWFPSGPGMMQRILRWAGFTATRVHLNQTQTFGQPEEIGHLEILAARDEAVFRDYDRR